MATIDVFVDPTASGSGTGNNWTDAYTSFATAESSRQTDLVSDGDIMRFNVRGGEDGPAAHVIDGWTTDSSNYIIILCSPGDRHDGTRNTGYYMSFNQVFDEVMECLEDYTEFHGVAFKDGRTGLQFNNADFCVSMDCLYYDGAGDGVETRGSSVSGFIINCFSYGAADDGFVANGDVNTDVFFDNCDSANAGDDGFFCVNFRDAVYINCYSGGSGGGDYAEEASSTTAFTDCPAEDGTGTSVVAFATGSGAFFTNVTPGSEDLHIGASSTLKDTGTDLSADANFPFNTDFEGDTRTGDWDIGPDQITGGTIHEMSGTGEIAVEGSAAIVNLAVMSSTGEIGVEGSAGISALISLLATGEMAVEGSAAIIAIISASATGEIAVEGTAALNGIFGLSADAEIGVEGQAVLNIIATMVADGEIAVAGSGDLTVVGAEEFANVSFSIVTKKTDLLDSQNKKTDILTQSEKHGDILDEVTREGI